ncbi:hypothetical protein [Alkalibaculum bacchi]|uniref:TOTE conflict system archaeo-eukaryotic primase domain-containing protein n=1 Tax=Alkalibaculum bacchi TaxID=645887 RepID=UPI0026ED254E|nr:hypothetical protein [Alkalibaculum bacchi]
MKYDELYKKYKLLEKENKCLRAEIQQLRLKLIIKKPEENYIKDSTIFTVNDVEQMGKLITKKSSSKEKIELFQSLFKGREDVCAKRWNEDHPSNGWFPLRL